MSILIIYFLKQIWSIFPIFMPCLAFSRWFVQVWSQFCIQTHGQKDANFSFTLWLRFLLPITFFNEHKHFIWMYSCLFIFYIKTSALRIFIRHFSHLMFMKKVLFLLKLFYFLLLNQICKTPCKTSRKREVECQRVVFQ